MHFSYALFALYIAPSSINWALEEINDALVVEIRKLGFLPHKKGFTRNHPDSRTKGFIRNHPEQTPLFAMLHNRAGT